jgi:hypothetical protein
VARERAHQRPRLALGSERCIDRPDSSFAGDLGTDPHHGRGDRCRAGVGRLRGEDDVDVAHVVELAATALAHADHSQPALGRMFATGDLERGRQCRLGEVGKLAGHIVNRDVAAHVARGEGQQAAAISDP